MKKINLAVIGVGRMGLNHVRVLSKIEQVQLKAICEPNHKIAHSVAKNFFIDSVYNSIEKMLDNENLDAVIIATPTTEHKKTAIKCLEQGLHIFIEKPMATSAEECEDILLTAQKKNKRLMVGHVERFNPVILALKEYLEQDFLGNLYYAQTIRSGPFPKRLYGSKDGVVIDLAVHDLDLIDYLFGYIKHIYAHHITTQNSHGQDIYARVMYKTKSGILGNSEFSWISPKRERSISIFGDKGLLIGNLLYQEVWYFENGDVQLDSSDNYYQNVMWGRVSEGKVIKYPIKKEEPLKNELNFFINIIKDTNIQYDPVHGKQAVEYSRAILDSAENNTIVHF